MSREEVAWFRQELLRLHLDVQSQLKAWRRVTSRLWEHYFKDRGTREAAAPLELGVENGTHHLLVAVTDIEKIAAALASRMTNVALRRQLELAMAKYKKDAGQARNFRNFYEHADEYIQGKGRLSGRTMWPLGVQVSIGKAGVAYKAEGKKGNPPLILEPDAAASAALQLAREALQVTGR